MAVRSNATGITPPSRPGSGRFGEGLGAIDAVDQRPAPQVGHAADHLDVLFGHRVPGAGPGTSAEVLGMEHLLGVSRG